MSSAAKIASGLFAGMLLALLLLAGAPALADGSWSGSTSDNGLGQSVTVEGHYTDTTNANGGVTRESESTTTIRDNASGKIISKIKRIKKKTIRKALGPDLVTLIVMSAVTSVEEETTTNNPDGSSTVTVHREGSDTDDNSYYRHDSTVTHGQPDGEGDVVSGQSNNVSRTPNSGAGPNGGPDTHGTRTTSGSHWDPVKKDWVNDPKTTRPWNVGDVSIVVPPAAGVGTVAQGTVLLAEANADGTQSQETASGGVVIIDDQKGHRSRLPIGADGSITLTGLLGQPGTLHVSAAGASGWLQVMRVKPNLVGLHPLPGQVAMPAHPLAIAGQNNTFSANFRDRLLDAAKALKLAQPGQVRVAYFNDDPTATFCTPANCRPISITSLSSEEITVNLPESVSPGRGALLVGIGNGPLAPPIVVNPVQVKLVLPATARVGQQFTGEVKLDGILPENAKRSWRALLSVSGPGSFANGQDKMYATFANGDALVQMIGRRAGVLKVTVSNITPAR